MKAERSHLKQGLGRPGRREEFFPQGLGVGGLG